MRLTAIVGATVIDGTGRAPVEDAVVLVEDDRIRTVARSADLAVPEQAQVIRADGRYVIPGLMDANVHLFAATVPDLLLELEGRYDEVVVEAAQIALRAGVTTVFDTWGPLGPLTTVRDRIDRGEVAGSRMFVGGNIIGFGGPLSPDFFSPGAAFGADTIARINQQWEQGVGPELTWLAAEDVRRRTRDYIERSGIDFVKYGGTAHKNQFIAFSELAQRAIVEEAHGAGLTAQAHTMSVESLRMEIDAGADLLQHGDITGAEPMPEATLRTIVERQLPVAALVCTEGFLAWVREQDTELLRLIHDTKDKNDRRLIDAGARLLLTTDALANGSRKLGHPMMADYLKDVVDNPTQLGDAHFLWLAAVVERGMAPMDALLAATRNVAAAYGQADLGTLEPGKRADLVVLEGDPLDDARNYRAIVEVMKDGRLVDRDALPAHPVLADAAAGELIGRRRS